MMAATAPACGVSDPGRVIRTPPTFIRPQSLHPLHELGAGNPVCSGMSIHAYDQLSARLTNNRGSSHAARRAPGFAAGGPMRAVP